MKILAIVVKKSTESIETFSVEDSGIEVLTVYTDDKTDEATVLNKTIKEIDVKYSHVVILPENFVLFNTFTSLLEEYYSDDKTVYLPLVNLQDSKGNFTGIINSSIWWPNLVENPGVLDKNGAYSQVDTTLYGGVIPVSILKKYKFKKDLNIYYHFEFLNKILSKEVNVVGIPKILLTILFDYTLENISREEKIRMFNEAREGYKLLEDNAQ